LVNRVKKKTKLSAKSKNRLVNELEYEKIIAQKILNSCNAYDSVKYLRSYEEDGKTYSLFGLYKEETPNFLVVEFGGSNAEVKIIDTYLFSEGLWLTEELNYSGLFSEDVAEQKFDLAYGLKVSMEALLKKDYNLAESLIDNFPANYRSLKPVEILNLLLSTKKKSTEFQKTLESFNTRFPKLKNHSLYISLLYYKRIQDCTKLAETVIGLEQIIGQEDFLLKQLKEDCGKKS